MKQFKKDMPAISMIEYSETSPKGRPINLFTCHSHQYYIYNKKLNQAGIPERK